MLQACGNRLFDHEKEVVLKGINLGSYLNLENFMMGYVGAEQQFRSYFRKYAGEEKYNFFFEKYEEYFFGEEDAKYLHEIGMNVIRLPFNYRILEDDTKPYTYKEEGFVKIDRVIHICQKYSLYVMLDLHAAQGCQNTDWHADCMTGKTKLFDDLEDQNRVIALWRAIATRYSDCETIAAYDLLNEPNTENDRQTAVLDNLYEKIIRAIREVDKAHMIVVNANHYNRDFEGFRAPYDRNLIFAIHHYAPASLQQAQYPDMSGDCLYNKETIRGQFQIRADYTRKYNVPVWVSEFGLLQDNPMYEKSKEYFLKDQLDIFQQEHCSWTIWSYKDLGYMGLVHPQKDMPWMNLTEKYLKLKKKYNCDFNTIISERWLLSSEIKKYVGNDFGYRYEKVRDEWEQALTLIFNNVLAEMFAEELAEYSMEELEELTASFRIVNCDTRKNWEKILKEAI